MTDISAEIKFKTARSSGKGGQQVNKVETMVAGNWLLNASALFSEESKSLLATRLANKINSEGFLQSSCSTARSQLENKLLLIKKMNLMVHKALQVPKKRKATRPTKAAKEKRLLSKKNTSSIKEGRKKIIGDG